MLLRNEFAVVEVTLDRSARGPRLRIIDHDANAEIFLDPVIVGALTRLRDEEIAHLVEPV